MSTYRRLVILAFPLLLLAPPAGADSVCDQLRAADARDQLLREAQQRLQEAAEQARTRWQEAQDKAAPTPERSALIAQRKADIDQKGRDMESAQRNLDATRRQAAGGELPPYRAALERALTELEAAGDELQQLVRARDKVRDDQAVATARREIRTAEESLLAVTGKVDLDELRRRVDDLRYCGAERSRLWILCTNRDRLEESGGVSDADVETASNVFDLDKLRAQERAVRNELQETFRRLDALREQQARAEEVAADHLDSGEKDVLVRSASVEERFAKAMAERTKAEENLMIAEQGVTWAAGKIPEREAELADLQAELDRLKAQASSKSPEELALEQAAAALKAVEDELSNVQDTLQRLQSERSKLERRLGELGNDLSNRLRQGKTLGSQAHAARRDGDASLCSSSLKAAQDALLAAAALASENRACLSAELLEAVDGTLRTTESFDCGTGPELALIVVPDLTNRPWREAQGMLPADLQAFSYPYLAPPRREDAGKVVGQSPRPGDRVRAGTTVYIRYYNEQWVDPDKARQDLERALDAPADAATGAWDTAADQGTTGTASGAWDAAADQGTAEVESHGTDPAASSTATPADAPREPSNQVAAAGEVARGAADDRAQRPASSGLGDLIPAIADVARQVQEAKSGRPGGRRSPPPSGRSAGQGTSGAGAERPECPIVTAGSQGNVYFTINRGGSPPGFEIRRTWDPPRGDANRLMCKTARACLEKEARDMGIPVPVINGPFTSQEQAVTAAKNACR